MPEVYFLNGNSLRTVNVRLGRPLEGDLEVKFKATRRTIEVTSKCYCEGVWITLAERVFQQEG